MKVIEIKTDEILIYIDEISGETKLLSEFLKPGRKTRFEIKANVLKIEIDETEYCPSCKTSFEGIFCWPCFNRFGFGTIDRDDI